MQMKYLLKAFWNLQKKLKFSLQSAPRQTTKK